MAERQFRNKKKDVGAKDCKWRMLVLGSFPLALGVWAPGRLPAPCSLPVALSSHGRLSVVAHRGLGTQRAIFPL